jgi:maltooligosyltrehalose trehalohydrolase
VHDSVGTPVNMPVAPFQYIESHDHSQLIFFVGSQPDYAWDPPPQRKLSVPYGDRARYYALQPFAIALLTCQGTPMLFQGQEFADNYVLPDDGNGRNSIERNLNWEYFYDDPGGALVRLYRILGTLRHACGALRSREPGSFWYYNDYSRPGDGVVAYRRQAIAQPQVAMVFLNFAGTLQSITVPFPEPGVYREMIDADTRTAPNDIVVANADQLIMVDVPSHYGCIFIKQP